MNNKQEHFRNWIWKRNEAACKAFYSTEEEGIIKHREIQRNLTMGTDQ